MTRAAYFAPRVGGASISAPETTAVIESNTPTCLRAKDSSQQGILDIIWARDLASKSALLSLPLREEHGL